MINIQLPQQTIAPGRIFCVGCNYAAHIKELGRDYADDRCVIFMKPNSCLVAVGEPMQIPTTEGAVHHEVELVVVIGKEGKNIPKEQARDHILGIGLGLDLTLRDKQSFLKSHGHPWELCKSFDNAAPISHFIPLEDALDLTDLRFSCSVNGQVKQEGYSKDMLYPIDQIIQILSKTWKLLPGDLIFTGTPPGIGPIVPGDRITIQGSFCDSFSWDIIP